jgi:phosphopantetheinyl transferase
MELDLNKSFNGYRAYIMDTGAFADDGIYGRCLDAVSEYRRCKVERLRRRDDRNASLAAGILLAHALRECAGIDERLVTYEKNKAGKPFIKDIQFSISHTEGCVAAAIGSEPCGIDVERVRRIPDSIVNRLYSDEDKKIVMSCAHPEIYSTCVWTRREAYSKMTGTGILMKDEEQQMVMDNAHMEKKNIWLGNYAVCRAECDGRMHMDEIADPAHAEGDMNIDFIAAFCAASDGTFSPDIKMIDSADIVCYYV